MKKNNNRCSNCGHIQKKHVAFGYLNRKLNVNCKVKNCKCMFFKLKK